MQGLVQLLLMWAKKREIWFFEQYSAKEAEDMGIVVLLFHLMS